jgi:hypothetical protein
MQQERISINAVADIVRKATNGHEQFKQLMTKLVK